jgi:cysteine dioxygenase
MNDVTYISDDIGLHRVHNPSSDQVAVSLHCKCWTTRLKGELNINGCCIVYTPPNAADYGYNIYNEVTGKASFVQQAQALQKE